VLGLVIVLVALRGDRGSQRLEFPRADRVVGGGGRPSGSPRIATGRTPTELSTRSRWRSPSEMAEDRNAQVGPVLVLLGAGWRSSSRTTEDRNRSLGALGIRRSRVAVALRTDRGSQRCAVLAGRRPLWPVAVTLENGRTIELISMWRSHFGATKDRNAWAARPAQVRYGVAVALRGGRGPQPLRQLPPTPPHSVAVVLWDDWGSQRLDPRERDRDHLVAVVLRDDQGSQHRGDRDAGEDDHSGGCPPG